MIANGLQDGFLTVVTDRGPDGADTGIADGANVAVSGPSKISTFGQRLPETGVMNTLLDFSHAFAASQFPHLFAVRGFDTPEECRAWFDGERTRFDDLDEWVADEPVHGVISDRLDERGFYLVALEDDVDAVHFKMRWCEHIVS